MTTETKRDLHADFALCQQMTRNWLVSDGVYVVNGEDWSTGGSLIAECEVADYARFIATAREGWEIALRRAIDAEATLRKLGVLNAVSDITERDEDFHKVLSVIDDITESVKEQVISEGGAFCAECGIEYEVAKSLRAELCPKCALSEIEREEWGDWTNYLKESGEYEMLRLLAQSDAADEIDDEVDGIDDPAYYS
ncbi:hypothetical protein [Paenibacillus xylanilyticus]|uniref:hypothetical protein n=1 Tax=Paenibacillus xylanilyticus TaxID=248903 RepID=UPI003AAB1335